jgi:hypothetical protein
MTLKKIPDSYVQPNRAWPASERYDLLVGNPAAQETQIYGTRKIKGALPAHTHGEDGGELLDEQLFADVPGPQGSPGTFFSPPPPEGNPTKIGIPICRRINDFLPLSTHPLGLLRRPVLLPGGVSALKIKLGVFWDTVGEVMRFRVWLASLARHNTMARAGDPALVDPPDIAAIVVTFTTPATLFYGSLEASFGAALLARLGDPRLDRLVELIIWQEYNPSSAARHRLCCVSGTITGTVGGRRVAAKDRSISQVTTGDILAGQALSTDVVGRLRTQTNGLTHATLGKPPGLREDLVTPDRRRSFVEVITRPHQHQGSLVPDPFGAFFSDGVVPRGFLFAESYPRDLGDSLTQITTLLSQKFAVGPKLHSSGALDSTWLVLKFRAAIPAGLLSFYLQFCLSRIAADDAAKVRAHISASSLLGEPGGVTSLQSGGSLGMPTYRASAPNPIEIDPLDARTHLRRLARLRAGLSPWATGAILGKDVRPDDVVTSTEGRISEAIRVELSHPAVRDGAAARVTGDYMVTVKIEVETPTLGGYDSGVTLNWICGVVGES